MREFFDDFEKDMMEAFSTFMELPCSWDPDECCLAPLTNIIETDEEVIVTADLPYVKKENIELTVTEDMLDLQAKLDTPIKFAQWGTIQRNIEFQKFHKHMKLPPNVNAQKIEANFKNGILKIRIPKNVTRLKIKIE